MYQISALDLGSGRRFEASIDHVAAEAGYYNIRHEKGGEDSSFELRLSKIETISAPVIEKLCETRSVTALSHSEREIMALFLLVLHMRGPRVRSSLAAIPRLILDELERRGDPPAPELRQELEAMALADSTPEHLNLILTIGREFPLLSSRRWKLLAPPIGSRFVCSDVPVLKENPIPSRGYGKMGLLCHGIIIYLALSPWLVLAILDDEAYDVSEEGVAHIDYDDFLRINWLTASHAQRYMFGREQDDIRPPPGAWSPGEKIVIG